MKKRIMFVDDEPKILDGLRRMLRPMRKEWDVSFAENGPAALELMEQEHFDVVISDMRMPGMDGAALLTEVKKRSPDTIRIVLSGQSDRETIFRSVGPAHQFMSKPCDAEKIKKLVSRAYGLRDLVNSDTLKRLVSQVGTLPSLPHLYTEIVNELQSADPSIKRVGEIIEKDVGMSVKILQLVNSAFFGLRDHVNSPSQAANLLGLDIVRSLVLMVHVFTELEDFRIPNFRIQSVYNHSLAVGACAQSIARFQRAEKTICHDASTAGFLHDSGKLILAVNLPDEYGKTIAISRNEKIPIWEAEKKVFHTTHAEVGAHLLGLWGLPNSIVAAVAFHHNPEMSLDIQFSSLTAVHTANVFAFEHQGKNEEEDILPKINYEYLSELGLDHCVSQWREACKEICQGSIK